MDDFGTKAETVRIKIVLGGGLALTAIAVFVMMLHSPSTVASSNGVPPSSILVTASGNASACQSSETLPAGTSAIRLQIDTTTGPQVSLEVFHGRRVITRGTEGTGWYGSVVTVPVRALDRVFRHATVCFQLSFLTGYNSLYGALTRPSVAATDGGKPLPGRFRIVYLRPSRQSWWSRAGAVITHMGLGRAASGTWIVLPIVMLAAAAFGLASWLVARELE